MEYNILDQLIDENNYGPNSAEWRLRGLSEQGQKALIHDLSRREARRAKNGGVILDAGMLEQRMLNLPEPIQDGIVASLEKAKTNYEQSILLPTPSQYDNSNNRIYIKRNAGEPAEDLANSLLHETAHYTDFNNSRRKKMRDMSNSVFLQRKSDLGDKNLGGTLMTELMENGNGYGTPPMEHDDYNFVMIKDHEGNEKAVREQFSNSGNEGFDKYMDYAITDFYRLHPYIQNGGPSHGERYKKGLQANAYRLGIEKSSNGKQDFSAVSNYPLSLEAVADIVPALSYDVGPKVFMERAPQTLSQIENAFANGLMVKNYVPRNRKYADEEGLRLIDERERKAAERRAKVLQAYNARFMTLPEDKRAYYENAQPGDILFTRYPDFYDETEPESNIVPFVKGAGKFVGTKVLAPTSYDGKFTGNVPAHELKYLVPGYEPQGEFLKQDAEWERKKFLNKKRKK